MTDDLPILEPDDGAPPPPDPPCLACAHPMSVHDEDGCYRCMTEGGPC